MLTLLCAYLLYLLYLLTYMAQVVLAELDCLLSLAACARDFELVRPTETKSTRLPTHGATPPVA